MNKYDISYSNEATNDLREIGWYITEKLREPLIAKKLLSRIRDTIRGLETLPRRFSKLTYKGLSREYRKMQVGNYTVIYYIDDENAEVIVSRIVYAKRSIRDIIKSIDDDAKD